VFSWRSAGTGVKLLTIIVGFAQILVSTSYPGSQFIALGMDDLLSYRNCSGCHCMRSLQPLAK